ncbi:hypothetical protein [Agrobacterium cavarae]|uniref:hypothetical protein n=1 Tax=Agrobacterium cavarae TaxID=2528239 RepID=UPI0028ADAC95|nr:hypothetical protein [Agrobacterium cavarae]
MRFKSWLIGLSAIGALFVPTYGSSAEISFQGIVGDQFSKEARFRLEGAIQVGDSGRLAEALRKANVSTQDDRWQRIVLALNSDGGSFHEGIDLAMAIRRVGISTIVRTDDECYSACAIAFLGGAERLKDPTPLGENDPLPNQPVSRSLEKGAKRGFHAPYLTVPDGNYNSETVQEAYRAAVLGIARLVSLADSIYVVTAELPRLLAPGRDEVYMADDVDAVGFLGIRYTDYSYQIRENFGFTHSMVLNACVNRYYHLQRRSSLAGFSTALSVLDEFVEGSKLMENGEDNIAFGVRRIKQGTLNTWLAYLPIAKTQDGTRFIWCLFAPDAVSPTTFYKPGGTIEEMFAELKGKNDLFDFSTSDTTVKLGTGDTIGDLMGALDLVPPQTPLSDIGRQLDTYRTTEKPIRRP